MGIQLNLREVPVRVFAKWQQHQRDDDHDGLDKAELQGGLLAEPQEANGVGSATEAAGATEPAGGS